MIDKIPQEGVEKIFEGLYGSKLSEKQKKELAKQTKIFYATRESIDRDFGGATGILARLHDSMKALSKADATKEDTKDTFILGFIYTILGQMYQSLKEDFIQQNDLIGQLHTEQIETNHYLAKILEELKKKNG